VNSPNILRSLKELDVCHPIFRQKKIDQNSNENSGQFLDPTWWASRIWCQFATPTSTGILTCFPFPTLVDESTLTELTCW